MATFPVDVVVGFTDSAERTAEVTYRLRELYDDAANAGSGNMGDTIQPEVDALVAALQTLTWDEISYARIQIVDTSMAGTPANVAANNQVRAFIRVTDASTGLPASIEVPAWDDAVFDQNNMNLLSPAFNVAAQIVTDLLANPETDGNFGAVQWSQSRTRKSRNVLS